MYLIYDLTTGKPRITLSSADLAEANLESGEAFIDLDDENYDFDHVIVVNGQVVQQELPAFDPVRYARHLRSGFLADSDWTQVTDSALDADTKQAWANYRKDLRDFPATIAAIAANEELAGHVGSLIQVEELLPTPPDGG
tara:strand:- start:27 stop:446 length:420 start_codon:yes stop_codon:yes gene_type:complete